MITYDSEGNTKLLNKNGNLVQSILRKSSLYFKLGMRLKVFTMEVQIFLIPEMIFQVHTQVLLFMQKYLMD